jgi:hypothetical protein
LSATAAATRCWLTLLNLFSRAHAAMVWLDRLAHGFSASDRKIRVRVLHRAAFSLIANGAPPRLRALLETVGWRGAATDDHPSIAEENGSKFSCKEAGSF